MRNDIWNKHFGQDLQANFRLFGFLHVGGEASFVHTWLERMRPDIELCAIQLPQIPDPGPPNHQTPVEYFIEALRRFNGIPQAVLDNPE